MSPETSGAPDPKELIARVQALVDTKPTEGGHSLEWGVSAYYLGDMTALAMASLRRAA